MGTSLHSEYGAYARGKGGLLTYVCNNKKYVHTVVVLLILRYIVTGGGGLSDMCTSVAKALL